MVKVCHMTSAHAPEDTRIFYKECVSLAKAGYEVYLVARGDSYEKNGVNIMGVGEVTGGRLNRMIEFTRRIYRKAISVDADVYHLHDPELLLYALKLKKRGKKVIFDSHEKYTEQLKNKPYLTRWITKSIACVYGFYESFVLKRIDAVIFPCTMNGKNPFENQCKHAVIISNAAILGEFFDLYDPNYPKHKNQVCYVGGLTEARGITNNILACSKAGVSLALAGEFSPAGYYEKLANMLEFSVVDERGRLSRKDIQTLLAESEIGLCTLLDQGQYLKIDTFGIKVFEYMSMALPVILSHSDYNDRMVEKYGFGICVDPNNVDEIAAAITYLQEHSQEAKRMGENGRRAVEEEFNWSVEEKKLLALYKEINKTEEKI